MNEATSESQSTNDSGDGGSDNEDAKKVKAGTQMVRAHRARVIPQLLKIMEILKELRWKIIPMPRRQESQER